jgi:hypothetical protein
VPDNCPLLKAGEGILKKQKPLILRMALVKNKK